VSKNTQLFITLDLDHTFKLIIKVSRDVKPCWLVKSYRRFGEAWSFIVCKCWMGPHRHFESRGLYTEVTRLSRVAHLRIHSLHTRRIQLMGTFVSNVCWPVCLIAPLSLSPLLNYSTNLAEIHNYAKFVTTGTTSPLLSSNSKNTIFWFYISKDELYARLRVRTALLMQILVFWGMTRCRAVHNYQLSGMACSLFLQDDKTEVETCGTISTHGFHKCVECLSRKPCRKEIRLEAHAYMCGQYQNGSSMIWCKSSRRGSKGYSCSRTGIPSRRVAT
jgi:hypothetical protein